MNKMIEKYIYSVTRRCKPEARDEIKKELESNILDMLQDKPNYTDKDIDDVLHQLGNPIDVAYSYQDEPVYLINPKFYQDYITIIKFGIITSTIIAVITGIIESVITLNANEPYEIIGLLLSSIISNIASYSIFIFAFITLIFASYNIPKIKTKVDERLKNWKISDLSNVPKEIPNIEFKSRIPTLFGMIISTIVMITLGIVFLVYYDSIFILVLNGVKTQVLNPIYKPVFTIYIIGIIVLNLISYIYKFYVGKENFTSLILQTISEFFGSIFMAIILLLPNLVLFENYESIASFLSVDIETVLNISNIITYSFVSIILIASFISYFAKWFKYLKNTLRSK
ncbi:hypothetical protein [Acholeplasma granularum]|uniref:hypothetical protein n=1 Tax=Acholeplasma granularum TaxID=264635 RepID=UPI000472B671|nr:hypothetical protein [Acholeplasma granularum]